MSIKNLTELSLYGYENFLSYVVGVVHRGANGNRTHHIQGPFVGFRECIQNLAPGERGESNPLKAESQSAPAPFGFTHHISFLKAMSCLLIRCQPANPKPNPSPELIERRKGPRRINTWVSQAHISGWQVRVEGFKPHPKSGSLSDWVTLGLWNSNSVLTNFFYHSIGKFNCIHCAGRCQVLLGGNYCAFYIPMIFPLFSPDLHQDFLSYLVFHVDVYIKSQDGKIWTSNLSDPNRVTYQIGLRPEIATKKVEDQRFQINSLMNDLRCALPGQDGRIWTCNLLNPNEAVYQVDFTPWWVRWDSNPRPIA